MLRIFNKLILLFVFFYFTNSYAIETEWSKSAESQVRLISPFSHNNLQNELYLGLHYKLKKDWKTYWKSSGAGGFPQEIVWQSSKNLKNLQILWPTPQYFEILDLISVGYIEEVIFPLNITIEDITKETVVSLEINYLTCKDICIPGNSFLEIIVPAGKGEITNHYFTIQKALSTIPKPSLEYAGLKNISTKAFEDNQNISILISAESDYLIDNPNVFLHSEFGLPVLKPEMSYSSNLKKINAKFNFPKNIISRNNFILNTIFVNNNKSFEYTKDIKIEKFSNIFVLNNSLIYIILLSLLGGLILNLMPCVLPVLSLKILSVLNQSKDKLEIRKSFILTSSGIIFSFLILAFFLIVVRFFGVNIGWGMQFQQPIFLIIIAIVLFIFTINLFGFYEFRTPGFINSVMIQKITSKGYARDFFNGFFATVLATPCSAPFVGTAITIAFTQSASIMFGIFFFMGLGMSLPYLFISIFPNMTSILPKPGLWMKYVKYFLGVLLLATFIWVISILLAHYSFFNSSNLKKDLDWIDFTTVNLNEMKEKNNIIFVDISADWCVTCKFNKMNAINKPIIQEYFKKNKVIKLRGDWTKPNKKIESFLNMYNKFGIPFNVIYSDSYPEGVILPELLTTKNIINSLDKVK